MAKRVTKNQALVFFVLLVFAAIFAGIKSATDAVGPFIPLISLVAVIGAFVWYRSDQRKKRVARLRNKYRDEAIVERIVQRCFWKGQTAEQLVDSLGTPAGVDTKVFNNKSRAVWKYDRRGINRFGLRVTLDDSIVVGWDQKS
jgi:hypothetical protein